MPINAAVLNARVARARSAVGRGIRYKLGHGGTHPEDELPTRDGYADCSGYIAWVLGINRAPKAERPFWIETTNIVRDATGKHLAFVEITKPIPGCVVVYGDRKVLGVHREGHVGLVTEVLSGGRFMVVDCSISKGGKTREAIREWDRSALFLSRKARFVLLKQDVT